MSDEHDDWTRQFTESMEKFNSRPIYKELSLQILQEAADSDLEQIVHDNIVAKFNDDWSNEFDIVTQLTNGRMMLYSTWGVEAEVNNGGFNQYYFNSAGQFAFTAVAGFRLIGANKFADLMERANDTVAAIQPDLEKFDYGTLEGFAKSYEANPLNDLDCEFYELYAKENLNELRIRYIRENPSEFTD